MSKMLNYLLECDTYVICASASLKCLCFIYLNFFFKDASMSSLAHMHRLIYSCASKCYQCASSNRTFNVKKKNINKAIYIYM